MYGGYRIHLLKEELPPYLKSFVICSNCEGILRDACAVGDTHSFMCLTCTQGRDSMVLKPSREAVANLVVSCPLKSRGCGWEGKISESEPHLDVCGLFRLECQLSCGDVIERSGMSTHLDKNCPLREIQCERCALIHKEKETNLHQENCLEFPLKCPNKCGDVLQREKLRQHTEVCENTIIVCPYKEYGCEVEVARKEMEQHKSENRLIHLEIKTDSLCGKLQVLQEENVLMKKEISILNLFFLFEGKLIFRINNLGALDRRMTQQVNVGDLKINIQKYFDMRNCLIFIFCSIESNNLLIYGELEFSREHPISAQARPLLDFEGCVVVVNQCDNSIHAKYEYAITFNSKRPFHHLLNPQLQRGVLARIPLEQILKPDIINKNSILVQLYYNMEKV